LPVERLKSLLVGHDGCVRGTQACEQTGATQEMRTKAPTAAVIRESYQTRFSNAGLSVEPETEVVIDFTTLVASTTEVGDELSDGKTVFSRPHRAYVRTVDGQLARYDSETDEIRLVDPRLALGIEGLSEPTPTMPESGSLGSEPKEPFIEFFSDAKGGFVETEHFSVPFDFDELFADDSPYVQRITAPESPSEQSPDSQDSGRYQEPSDVPVLQLAESLPPEFFENYRSFVLHPDGSGHGIGHLGETLRWNSGALANNKNYNLSLRPNNANDPNSTRHSNSSRSQNDDEDEESNRALANASSLFDAFSALGSSGGSNKNPASAVISRAGNPAKNYALGASGNLVLQNPGAQSQAGQNLTMSAANNQGAAAGNSLGDFRSGSDSTSSSFGLAGGAGAVGTEHLTSTDFPVFSTFASTADPDLSDYSAPEVSDDEADRWLRLAMDLMKIPFSRSAELRETLAKKERTYISPFLHSLSKLNRDTAIDSAAASTKAPLAQATHSGTEPSSSGFPQEPAPKSPLYAAVLGEPKLRLIKKRLV